jgi:hypothetical protein
VTHDSSLPFSDVYRLKVGAGHVGRVGAAQDEAGGFVERMPALRAGN